MGFRRFRAVLAAALVVGVLAPAALPTPAAAATGKYCQTAWYNFTYWGMKGNTSSSYYYWTATIQLRATGCWTSTQTWDQSFAVYQLSGRQTYIKNKAGAPSGPWGTTNFWANLQTSWTELWLVAGWPYQVTGWYGLYPRIYLNPSSSTTSGNWSSGSMCGLDTGSDVSPCKASAGSRVYLSSAWAA